MPRRAVAGHIVICAESAIKSPAKYLQGLFIGIAVPFSRAMWTPAVGSAKRAVGFVANSTMAGLAISAKCSRFLSPIHNKKRFSIEPVCHTLHGLSGIGECRSERSPQSFDFCATLRRAGRTECGLFHRSQARILRSQKRPPVETSGFGGIMDSFRQNGQFSEIPRVKIPKIWVFPKSDFTFPKSNFTIQETRSGARGRAGFCRESPAEAALRVSAPAFVCVPALRRAGRALQK
mgnify:CR=1 FL=1